MKFLGAGITDVGIRKLKNQDSLLIKIAKNSKNEEVVLGIICDGMGGLEKGEVASATVIKKFEQWFINELPKTTDSSKLEQIANDWTHMIRELNYRIMQYGKSENISLGTTFSGILIINHQYLILHIGDSRIYKLTDKMEQMTKDQTFVQREIDRGNMTKEEAQKDSRKNLLLQCVGASREVVPEIRIGDIEENTIFVLCSDGFRHVLSETEIFDNLNFYKVKNKEIMEYNSRQLIELVKSRNEKDNITVGTIKCIL